MKTLCLFGFMCMFPLFGAPAVAPQVLSEMIEVAIEGRKMAYAPYSNYAVGAALLTKSGKIYSGSNIENASYGLCNCAERTAVFKAVSEGDKELKAIVVATKDGGSACGTCRQVLNEFNPDMVVIAVDQTGQIKSTSTIKELLPRAFGPANLE